MADELAKALAEAKKKMFGNLQPSGGKTVVLVKGDANFRSPDKNIEIRKVT